MEDRDPCPPFHTAVCCGTDGWLHSQLCQLRNTHEHCLISTEKIDELYLSSLVFSLTWWIRPSADYGVLMWTHLLPALWGLVTSSRWNGDNQFSVETPSKDGCRLPAFEAVDQWKEHCTRKAGATVCSWHWSWCYVIRANQFSSMHLFPLHLSCPFKLLGKGAACSYVDNGRIIILSPC